LQKFLGELKCRVLIVDDDPLVCELVKEVPTSVEMDAVTLTESKEASSRLANEKFQAVFLFVQASRTLPLGSMVQILLELKAGSPPLAFPARIVRTAANDCMGLQIENAGRKKAKNSRNFSCQKFSQIAISSAQA
jgi:CheY-like chemotaxis protein